MTQFALFAGMVVTKTRLPKTCYGQYVMYVSGTGE